MSITKKDLATKVEEDVLPLLRQTLRDLSDPKEQQNNTAPPATNKEKPVYELGNEMILITVEIVSKINRKLGTTNNVMKVIEEKKDSCESIIQAWTEILKKEEKAMKLREVRIKEQEDDHIVPD